MRRLTLPLFCLLIVLGAAVPTMRNPMRSPEESKVIRRAWRALARHFDNDAHRAFRAVDGDRNGCISEEEARRGIKHFGVAKDATAAKFWAREFVRGLDRDGDRCLVPMELMEGLNIEAAYTTEPRKVKEEL